MVARASLATAWKQVSVETNKAICEYIAASHEAKQTPHKSDTISKETKTASHQRVNTVYEATKLPMSLK